MLLRDIAAVASWGTAKPVADRVDLARRPLRRVGPRLIGFGPLSTLLVFLYAGVPVSVSVPGYISPPVDSVSKNSTPTLSNTSVMSRVFDYIVTDHYTQAQMNITVMSAFFLGMLLRSVYSCPTPDRHFLRCPYCISFCHYILPTVRVFLLLVGLDDSGVLI